MDRLKQYRKIIQELLQDCTLENSDDANFETQVLCDQDNDHHQLVSLGWQGHRRFYSVLMHLDIKVKMARSGFSAMRPIASLRKNWLKWVWSGKILYWDYNQNMPGWIRAIVWLEHRSPFPISSTIMVIKDHMQEQRTRFPRHAMRGSISGGEDIEGRLDFLPNFRD